MSEGLGEVGASPSVAIALPAYNEADGIAEFLGELDECFAGAAIDVTFVVVDDCSTDETSAVLRDLGDRLHRPLIAVTAPVNRGHGPTTLDAYRRALDLHPAVVLKVDGDGQFEGPDVVDVARRALESGEIAVGRRVGRSGRWYRTVLTEAVRWYLRIVFGVMSPDPNSPLRAYPYARLNAMVADVPAEATIPNIYLTVLSHRSGRSPAYLPVAHRVRRGADPEGTTWRGAGRFIPSRLVRLVVRAATESFAFRRSLAPSTAARGGR